MAYNHGREDRKWRIWKEAEEKVLRECGVNETVIEQTRTDDRADFNSNRVIGKLRDMTDEEFGQLELTEAE